MEGEGEGPEVLPRGAARQETLVSAAPSPVPPLSLSPLHLLHCRCALPSRVHGGCGRGCGRGGEGGGRDGGGEDKGRGGQWQSGRGSIRTPRWHVQRRNTRTHTQESASAPRSSRTAETSEKRNNRASTAVGEGGGVHAPRRGRRHQHSRTRRRVARPPLPAFSYPAASCPSCSGPLPSGTSTDTSAFGGR